MVIVTHGKRLYCIQGIVNETGAGSHLLSVNKTTINEGQSGRRERERERVRSGEVGAIGEIMKRLL